MMTNFFSLISRRLVTPGRLARPDRASLLALLLVLLLALTAQAQAPPCANGNTTPEGDVAIRAFRLRQSFTQTCTGVLQNVTFTPVQSSKTTIANIIDDLRRNGYFVHCNLKDAAGNILATTPRTNQWFAGATVVFDFSAANLLLTTGTVYSWELEEVNLSAALSLLHISPTNEYAGGSLTQDGVNRDVDARRWVVNTAPAVAAGTIAGPLCAGAAVSVPFTAYGTIRAGNVYTAQLSNASGSFAAPVSIGTLSSTAASGTVAATVPAGMASGTGYRIRVSASTAGFAPVPNPSDLTINGTAAPTGAASQRFLPGATVNDLAATGTAVKWYAASSGSAALAATTPLVNGTVYYATQTVGGFESCNRLAVAAVVVAVAPTVTTAATLLTAPAATLGGNVTADGGAAITARGVVYSTSNPMPTLNGANITTATATLGTGTGNFTVPVTGLSVGTRYYVRAYATNVQGTSYGEVQQLTPAYPYRALALTGFTDDVVAEASPFSNSPLNLTNNNFDGGLPGYVLYERGYAGVNTAPRGLPVGGSFTSAVTAGLPYQFGSYTGGNSLRLAAGGSGTLTPGPRPVAKTLYVLASSGGAATAMTLTLNFVGGGSQTTASLPVADWFYSSGGALTGFDRVQRTATTRQAPENNPGALRLYEIAVPIAPGNQDKLLRSVTVHNTGGGSGILHVMALSVELTPVLLTQATAYDNALQLVTVPVGTTATAQGWGGGGAGNDGVSINYSKGGGGGGYTTAVLGAGSYVLTTGAGGTSSGDGNGAASTLTTTSGTLVLLAAGGTSGLNGGTGGRAADSTPGSPGAVSGTDGGILDFLNGDLTGGSGGTAGGPGGGSGGAGGTFRVNSAPGAAPGGGGGGGSIGGGTDGFGSAGGAGRLVLTPALPLPVELVAFTAQASGPAAVRLAWATASEKNSARFEVERSLDGRTFAPIGTMAAAGSSSAPRRYDFLDRQYPGGASLLYYRLRQVDLDATFSYSPVRTVALTGAAAGLALFPNPSHGAATLTGAVAGTVVTVLDALGRQVISATVDADGTAALVLPAGLPAGVYVVRAGGKALRLTVE